nr:DUF2927 domain-containing protein [Aurantimonas sp. CSK15Z-1]
MTLLMLGLRRIERSVLVSAPHKLGIAATLSLLLLLPVPASCAASDERMIDGFVRVVFSSEFSGPFGSGHYVRKFAGPVRFALDDAVGGKRRRAAERFLRSLPGAIHGLDARLVQPGASPNFVVHLLPRRDYQRVGRQVYGNPFMTVPGSCIVRARYDSRGIVRSDALIVADEGDRLFRRCLVEEVLQGLGPLDDDAEAPQSVFNDRSTASGFTAYDRIILNMLCDDRLRPGMSEAEVRPLLPGILRSARRRVRAR